MSKSAKGAVPWRRSTFTTKSAAAKRLGRCARDMRAGLAPTPADCKWLGRILTQLALGEEVRSEFFDPPGRGRRTEQNDREFWMTVDALSRSKRSAAPLRNLYRLVARKWGGSVDAARLAISREIKIGRAAGYVEANSLDDIERTLRLNLPYYVADKN